MATIVTGGGRRGGKPAWWYSEEYRAYLASDEWKARRLRAITLAGGCCQGCGAAPSDGLDVHHRTYERLGDERDDDLLVVCRPCHVEADRVRADETAGRRYEAQLDGWARKVYGDDWRWRENTGYVEEQFDRWLERKGERW